MCAIIGSYNLNTVKELIELNKDRGNVCSITIFYKSNPLRTSLDYDIRRGNIDHLDTNSREQYFVVHLQTNTSDDESNLQPLTNENNQWLIHNGIQKETEEINSEYDTLKLFKLLNSEERFETNLNNFNGSFAAMYLNNFGALYMFRNTSCPLYINTDTLDISSISSSFADTSIDANVIYHVDILSHTNVIKKLDYRTFKSKDNDYFFA